MRGLRLSWISLLFAIAGFALAGVLAHSSSAAPRSSPSELMGAARSGNLDGVKALLESGAKTDPQDRVGNTALILAAGNDRDAIVSLLLEHGADPNQANRAGQTALTAATDREDAEMVNELLAHGADVDHLDGYGRSALFEASRRGNREIVTALLKKDASPHFQNRTGNTALIWSARKGYPEIAKQLLAHAPDPNVKNNRGENALHWAVMARHRDVAILLLEANADVHSVNSGGNTALHISTAQGDVAIVRALLEHDASPDPSSAGWTPLMLAASAGNDVVAALLLQHGAKPSAKNRSGWTALDFARSGGYRSLVDTLVGAGAVSGGKQPQMLLAGTGFFVDDSGHFVTREHVVRACDKGIRINGGAQPLKAEVVETDFERHLALLRVSGAQQLSPPRVGASGKVRVRAAVAAVGYSASKGSGADIQVAEGKITGASANWRSRDEFEVVFLEPPLTVGGPILDVGAKVIGIVSTWRPWRIDSDMRLTFSESEATADKSDVLTAFLESHEVAYTKGGGGAKLSDEKLAVVAKQFTRSVECIR